MPHAPDRLPRLDASHTLTRSGSEASVPPEFGSLRRKGLNARFEEGLLSDRQGSTQTTYPSPLSVSRSVSDANQPRNGYPSPSSSTSAQWQDQSRHYSRHPGDGAALPSPTVGPPSSSFRRSESIAAEQPRVADPSTFRQSLPRIQGAADPPELKVSPTVAMVLPTTTYAQAPPPGGWKIWLPQAYLTFAPPPLKSQNVYGGFECASPSGTSQKAGGTLSAPSSPPKASPELPFSLRTRGKSSSGDGAQYGILARKKMGDMLNLWGGKRLNKAEIILEEKLNTLRQDPDARLLLEDTVRQYNLERRAVVAALTAKAEAKGKTLVGLPSIHRRRSDMGSDTGGSLGGAGGGDGGTMASRTHGQDRSSPQRASPGHHSAREYYPTTQGESHGATANGGHLASHVTPESPAPTSHTTTSHRRAPMYQVTLSEWKSRRKHMPEAQLKREDAAATVIQSRFRGYRQRKVFAKMHGSAIKIQKAVKARYAADAVEVRRHAAADVIVQFLQRDCHEGGVGNYKLLRQQFIRKQRAEKNMGIIYTMRVALLARQWASVEKNVLHTAKRRSRASTSSPGPGGSDDALIASIVASGGVQHSKKDKARLMESSLVARKRGILPGQAAEEGDDSRNLTPAAMLDTVHATDRLIVETMSPVPKEVKGAIIAVYLEAKRRAYHLLIGLHWKAVARHRRDNKRAEMLAAARSVVTNHATEALNVPQKPRLPRMRILATVAELKPMMQQGVAETALFHAYVLKANLDEYEAELQAENQKIHANPEVSASVKAKKKHALGSKAVVAAPSSWVPSIPDIDELTAGGPTGAFAAAVVPDGLTLTPEQRRLARSLKEIWWKDAVARAGPCMRKRWQLLKVELLEGLQSSVHQTPEQMAAFLTDQRNHPGGAL